MVSELWAILQYANVYEPFGTNTKTKNEKYIYLLFLLVQIQIKKLLVLPPIE